MDRKTKAALAALVAATFASGASAQSINPALDPSQGDTRVLAAVTLPLGHASDRTATAPRFEIISRSRTSDGVLAVVARDEERRWQERRIGFTLDGSDQLMINGRAVRFAYEGSESGDGISTLGAIGIGVGILLIGTIFVISDGVDALQDISDPD